MSLFQELQSRGVYDKLGTRKERRKNLVPFSTPSRNHTGHSGGSGRIFGKRLSELSKLLVSLIENQVSQSYVSNIRLFANCRILKFLFPSWWFQLVSTLKSMYMLKEFTECPVLPQDKK